MSLRLTLLLFTMVAGLQTASAQLTKTIHNSFEIDSLKQITLTLEGDYTVSFWEGNTILTESNVELYDASPNIFKHFIKMGRYDVDFKKEEPNGNVFHKQMNRKPIYTAKGQSWEVIKVKIYMPDTFEETAPNTYTRISKLVNVGQ